MKLVPLRPPAKPEASPTAILDLVSARVSVSVRLVPLRPPEKPEASTTVMLVPEGAREDTSAKTSTVERSRSFAFAVDLTLVNGKGTFIYKPVTEVAPSDNADCCCSQFSFRTPSPSVAPR